VPIISGGGGGGTVNPATLAGYEIGYAQITSNANITDTSEATATALISPGAITFDGSAVYVEVFAYLVLPSTGGFAVLTLFEGATEITRLANTNAASGAQPGGPVCARYKFSPTAGAHTYTVCAFAQTTTGTPKIMAGSGGTGGAPPAYVRFVKA